MSYERSVCTDEGKSVWTVDAASPGKRKAGEASSASPRKRLATPCAVALALEE